MKKLFNIYDISSGDGVFIQTVTKEISARLICSQHNKNGIIKDVGGKARLEEGSVRIIGGWKKDTVKRLYNMAI